MEQLPKVVLEALSAFECELNALVIIADENPHVAMGAALQGNEINTRGGRDLVAEAKRSTAIEGDDRGRASLALMATVRW